jgi:nucleotidyltransferase/DNA polymerase involved in DNA repair
MPAGFSYVARVAARPARTLDPMTRLREWPDVYAHVDMDAFFVSVELLRRPELQGKPVIVATGTDAAARGVVMAASYEARRFGVHSALPLATAHRRCPQAVLLPRDIGLYRRASARVMDVLRRFSDRVEVAGLDEAYLDLSGSPAPMARARQVKRDMRDATGLVCSVGLAPNKLLAKIASDLEKPDGLCVLEPDGMLEAVGERPVTLIPGVGVRTAERLAGLGVRTVAELAAADNRALEGALSPRLGRELQDRARGLDHRPLVTDRERKSESRETTFPADVTDAATLQLTLDRLVDSVCRGLANEGRAGRTVTLKIRLRPFRTHTRSRTLEEHTRDPQRVRAVARQLLDDFSLDAPVRLLGVGVSGLAGSREQAAPARPREPAAQGALALDV